MPTEYVVHHPRLRGVTRTVTGKAAREAHKKAGWRMTPIGDDRPAPSTTPEPEPEPDAQG